MTYDFDEIIDREGTDSYKYDLRERVFGTKEVLPLWVADMDFRTPDFIIEAVKKRADHPIYGYSIRSASFNKAIAGWMKRRFNWNVDPGRIAFSPGVVPAINLLIMAFSEPGETVVVQPPVYHPFFHAITHNGRRILHNPLRLMDGRLCMDLEHLRAHIDARTRIMLLCSPHNPGGSVWTPQELTELATICRENNMILISDEIHHDIVYKPHRHIPTATLSKEIEDITITCVAPSKTFNIAGLATSALIIPRKKLLGRYLEVLDRVHVGSGTFFGHVALEAAYTNGDGWLEELLAYLWGNINYALDYFQKTIPQITPVVPQGTFMLWLDCRKLRMTAQEMKEFFVTKARIGFSDGAIFGPGGEGFQRMNIACPRPVLKMALDRLAASLPNA